MKKRGFKRGFTLAEMLIAVLLLGLVSVMATVMVSAVLDNTVMAKEVAQAEILGSEALDNIQAELRFALDVDVVVDEGTGNKGTITFGHDKANPNCSLALNGEGSVVLQVYATNGDLISETELFDGVSYGNLKISALTFERVDNGAADSVKVTVSVAYGNRVLWQGSVSVRPINGMADESSVLPGAGD